MNTGLPLLDAIEADKRLEASLTRVRENNEEWSGIAFIQLCNWVKTHDGWANTEHGFSGEDIRYALTPLVGKPRSPNAWGALIAFALRRGIIEATGEYRKMKCVTSNARKTAVYRAAS